MLRVGQDQGGVAPGERLLRIVEAVGVFVLGAVLMNYFYAASTPRLGDEIGVPEHDSYYHVAMASMLPEHGLLPKFPWLQYVYFRNQGDAFVSHHVGFHVLLLPFVKASEWLTGDALAGGRWAMSAVLGANLMLFHLLLRQRRVPLHWLWIAAVVLLPDQFFARHGFVRAIGASLLFVQLTLLLLFAKRYVWAGLALAAYVHVYLGGVIYGPIIVAVYFCAQLIAPRDDRSFAWKMALITAAGWALGYATYPYWGVWEFLKMQVLGSGISPDIQVGREWFPYTSSWFLMEIAGPLVAVWTTALLLRLRFGPRLDARETTLVALQCFALLGTLSSRRFIEYWPPLCLLSAAYLATPPLARMIEVVTAWFRARRRETQHVLAYSALLALGVMATGVILALALQTTARGLFVEWKTWLAVTALLALPAFARIWIGRRFSAIIAGGAMVLIGIVAFISSPVPMHNRTTVPNYAWGILAAAYGLIPLLAMPRMSAAMSGSEASMPVVRTIGVALLAILLPNLALAAGARSLASASRQVRCYYDLGDIRELMAFLKQHSRPGDIVFTDDWDIFPAFFYHNRQNHYIVGLDPKFTQQRQPELWERYVKISRGEVPSTIRLTSDRGGFAQKTVGLTDIRDHFRARFVIADYDHRRLADRLAAMPEFAEFIYPGTSYEKSRNAPYVVFRVRDPGEVVAASKPTEATVASDIYLSGERPVSATQGWGDLGADRSVDGNLMRMHGKLYRRGLGTHAPAKLTYNIPAESKWFEATLGIDDETAGRGSAVASIYLDGNKVYESPPLLGGAEPLIVRIPLGEAKQMLLQADTTSDGQRYDHVNWAEARFVPASPNALHEARDEAPTSAEAKTAQP